MNLYQKLSAAFPTLTFSPESELAPLTTVKLGGPAEVLLSVDHSNDLKAVVQYCLQQKVPLTLLGWGANTLIADRGIRGLVIQNKCREVEIFRQAPTAFTPTQINERLSQLDASGSTFAELDYDESNLERVAISVASGAPLPWLLQHCLQHNLTGLQWFSRIPATLGGAVVNNIHGGTHFLSEYIESVEVITPSGDIETWPSSQLQFGYDTSIFHATTAIITRVSLQLFKGDVARAQLVSQRWAQQKKHQPQRSLGCVFHNLSPQEQERLHLPTSSTGYFIDHILNLKGLQIGGARVSERHAAFIETDATATAHDYLAVIHRICQSAASHKVKLQLEIFCKGFTQTELSDIL